MWCVSCMIKQYKENKIDDTVCELHAVSSNNIEEKK